jgi:argininosuccinate lyase
MLAYVEMLQRDLERLTDARVRVNVSPIGCGAVAGTSLPLNRARTAELLGFPAFTRNSIDTTADRDFLAELAFDCAMIAVHLSRWAEDWIIQSTTEFGFIELSDAYCTSSSMMPQKKNADTLELIRGKSASAIAQLTGLLTMLKGLPLAYNRDLQDDKRFAFSTVETTLLTLKVAAGIAATAKLRVARIARDLEEGFLDATSLAEYLTRQGVPFRQAHHIVGSLVATAEKQGKKLAELSNEELAAASDQFGEEARNYLGTANVVKRYQPDGAGGLKQLSVQLAFWKKVLSK